jgi:outer membrane protein assembly factor BamB
MSVMKKKLALVGLMMALSATALPASAEGTCSAPDDNRCELWSTTWDSGLNETPKGAHPERPNDLAVRGRWLYTVGESNDGGTASDVFILKSDVTTGELRWARRVFTANNRRPFDAGYSIAIDRGDATLFIAGTRRYDFEGHGDIFLAAFSARSGRKLWNRNVHRGRSWGGEAEVLPNGGGVAVTGQGRYDGLGRQVITARYSAAGERLWKRHFGGEGRDAAMDLATDGSDVFVSTSIDRDRRSHQVTLAYNQKGQLLWETAPDRVASGHPYGGGLRYHDGLLYRFSVTQDLDQGGGVATSEMYAIDSATGDIVWSDLEVNPKTGFVGGSEMALSPDGEVVYGVGLPGTLPTEHFEEFGVRAYDARTGDVLWSTTYDPAVGDVYLTDAVAREEGLVVGAIYMPGFGRDLLTLSLARTDGSVLWSARHNPSNVAGAEVNGGTMNLGPDEMVIHAGDVYFGESPRGTGYRKNDVVIAAYE